MECMRRTAMWLRMWCEGTYSRPLVKGFGYARVVLVSGEARLNNKQVGCQEGAQSEEGAFVAPLRVR